MASKNTSAGRLASSYRDLEVYKTAFRFQQAVFDVTKIFPKEETYSLTDQLRRSSRSVGANIAESWSKRRYPSHFVSKLTDSDAELQETTHWLRTAYACDYLKKDDASNLASQADSIGRMLNKMMASHEQFCFSPGASSMNRRTAQPTH